MQAEHKPFERQANYNGRHPNKHLTTKHPVSGRTGKPRKRG